MTIQPWAFKGAPAAGLLMIYPVCRAERTAFVELGVALERLEDAKRQLVAVIAVKQAEFSALSCEMLVRGVFDSAEDMHAALAAARAPIGAATPAGEAASQRDANPSSNDGVGLALVCLDGVRL